MALLWLCLSSVCLCSCVCVCVCVCVWVWVWGWVGVGVGGVGVCACVWVFGGVGWCGWGSVSGGFCVGACAVGEGGVWSAVEEYVALLFLETWTRLCACERFV